MSQPPSYSKSTSFAADESNAVSGRSTVRTAALDAEFAAVEATLDATLANLALIQRDDGEIRDGMVKSHTLGNDVRALLAAGQGLPRGLWVTLTVYALRDMVVQSGNSYICAVPHTAGTFATDLAAGKWLLMALGSGPSASAVAVTPTGSLTSTNAQAAFAELDADLTAGLAATVAAVNASLADATNAAKGVGQIGSLWTLNYVAGTAGNDLRYGSVPSIFKVLSQAQQQDVLAYTFTLDLYATIANAYALCKTWYFPAGGYKLTDEIVAMTGMRVYGDSNGDRFYGAQPTIAKPTRFWQATGGGKGCFKIGVGVSDVVMSDFCMSAVQTPSAYTAPTSGKYGVKMEGAAYVAAGTAIQQAGRSSYRITLRNLIGYQFERLVSCADYYWETTGVTPPNGAPDWQCDKVTLENVHGFSCLDWVYLNTINADAWKLDGTAAIWTNGAGVRAKRAGYWSAENSYWTAAESSAGVFCTGGAAVYIGDYQSDIVELKSCQAEFGLTYSIKVDSTVGYASNDMPINIRSSAIEAPVQLDRKCKLNFDHSRASAAINVAGDDVVIEYDFPLFIGGGSFNVTGLRFKRIPRPAENGSTASVATATATTIITFPASAGRYEVDCWLTGGGSIYTATARLICDGTTLVRTGGDNGANVTLTVSGRNVQVTQTSGVSQTMQWAWRRLA